MEAQPYLYRLPIRPCLLTWLPWQLGMLLGGCLKIQHRQNVTNNPTVVAYTNKVIFPSLCLEEDVQNQIHQVREFRTILTSLLALVS